MERDPLQSVGVILTTPQNIETQQTASPKLDAQANYTTSRIHLVSAPDELTGCCTSGKSQLHRALGVHREIVCRSDVGAHRRPQNNGVSGLRPWTLFERVASEGLSVASTREVRRSPRCGVAAGSIPAPLFLEIYRVVPS